MGQLQLQQEMCVQISRNKDRLDEATRLSSVKKEKGTRFGRYADIIKDYREHDEMKEVENRLVAYLKEEYKKEYNEKFEPKDKQKNIEKSPYMSIR